MVTEPKWLKAARAKLGTKEAAGSANSATILGWAKRLGTKVLGMVYNADQICTGARRRVSLPDAEPRRAVRAIVGSLATGQDVLEFGE
jgi:hypothetical protein